MPQPRHGMYRSVCLCVCGGDGQTTPCFLRQGAESNYAAQELLPQATCGTIPLVNALKALCLGHREGNYPNGEVSRF